jgi:hypothetical protein
MAVQIVWSCHRGSRDIEHLGSAYDDAQLELLKASAGSGWQPGMASLTWAGTLAHRAARCRSPRRGWGCVLDALLRGYDVLGFGEASGGDMVFRDLVLARIIEPASKLASVRVLEEAAAAAASYQTVKRRLPAYAKEPYWQEL